MVNTNFIFNSTSISTPELFSFAYDWRPRGVYQSFASCSQESEGLGSRKIPLKLARDKIHLRMPQLSFGE